uniref:Rho guanine nucleotide exchange factor 15-like n=1 Tax=Gouania willdenowi TaxID=441366 RepID=A0A8C5ETI9_GOUWI
VCFRFCRFEMHLGILGSILQWERVFCPSEPLYQTYRASVITKEIRRQTVSPSSTTGNGGLRSSPVPSPGQSTLWQDLQKVRDSGVLEQLSPELCKYQESMFEVVTSETSYLRSLRVLTDHFMDNRELEKTLIIRDKKTLFSNVLRVREVSERFLKDLEERVFEELVFPDICDIIHYHAQHNFPAYIDYVRNQIFQEKIFTKLMKDNVQFAAVISRLQESPQCQRLPFMSFLLLPFQRITRIKMLIENILKRTKEGTNEEQTASKALASVSKIIDECNTQVGKMKQTEELIHISKTLEFDKLKAIPIISQSRYLEKKGELQEMSKGGTLFNSRLKFNSVYLFLFNDLLLITIKKSSERFVVVDHTHRSLVQVEAVADSGNSSSPLEHCFNLTMLENHQGREFERLLKAPSQSDMHRWMAAFPNPTNPDGNEDEVIYEDWGEN